MHPGQRLGSPWGLPSLPAGPECHADHCPTAACQRLCPRLIRPQKLAISNATYYKRRVLLMPERAACQWAGLASVGCDVNCNTWLQQYDRWVRQRAVRHASQCGLLLQRTVCAVACWKSACPPSEHVHALSPRAAWRSLRPTFVCTGSRPLYLMNGTENFSRLPCSRPLPLIVLPAVRADDGFPRKSGAAQSGHNPEDS